MKGTWPAEREADQLPVGYFHVVYTLPAQVADVAFHNRRGVALHDAGRLAIFGSIPHLTERGASLHNLASVRKKHRVVYAKASLPGRRRCWPMGFSRSLD